MNDENSEKKEDGDGTKDGEKEINKTCFFIAIGCFVVACVLFALSFTIKNAGVYTLFGSLLSSLAALSFLNGQKKRGYFSACKILRILCYAIMAAAIIVVVVGIIVSASANE